MEDIAIIGFSFKLPQDVNDVDSFWDTLQARRNLMTEWPKSRMNVDAFCHPELSKRSKQYARGGYFINEDPGNFDAPFFSVTSAEAASMDPMQRWTLEASYRAFENAGIPTEKVRGTNTSVFSASMTDDYSRIVARDPENTARSAVTGTFASILPNRVSWYFDLLGPSVHVDTACSSSLVAVDLACQSLWGGDASTALVTGSNLLLGPDGFLLLSQAGFLSPDSKCYSFDHRANGYARGEGVVALLLKPLPDAVRDGDMIRAVIRSVGTNQDGHTPGLTQPSSEAQERLIRHVYKKASLSFETTRYVEAHGTGTPVGDPIEMKAIGRVFRQYRSSEEPLYVGSVKANIGHLEGSSGLAGLVKSILMLEKAIIPPTALFEKVNPDIDADFYHVEVPQESIPWPSEGLRRVSLNSFGFGGTNTHVVLDDARHYLQARGLSGTNCTVASAKIASPKGDTHTNGVTHTASPVAPTYTNGNGALQASEDKSNANSIKNSNGIKGTQNLRCTDGALQRNGNSKLSPSADRNGTTQFKGEGSNDLPCKLLVWSAADERAVDRMIRDYSSFYTVDVAPDAGKVAKLAYTLGARRTRMLWRAFAVVNSDSGQYDAELPVVKPVRSSAEAGLALVFTGQGAQYAQMGHELLQYPIFATTLTQVNEIYQTLGCRWSVFDELCNPVNIDKPEYSQPLCTALQIALVELLRDLAVLPKAVVGHSSGEIAAAYTTGALSLSSACKVSYFRGLLAGKLKAKANTAGAMMSVNLAEENVEGYLTAISSDIASMVTVACINSPSNCTLSGSEAAIDTIREHLEADGIFAKKIKTGVAYHSSFMSIIADEYLSSMGTLGAGTRRWEGASIPMVSSVTGEIVRAASLTKAEYWVKNLVSPVRFSDAIRKLVQSPATLKVGAGNITDLLEVGPTAALQRPVQDTIGSPGKQKKQIRYFSLLRRNDPPLQSLANAVGHLFCHGHTVSIPATNLQHQPGDHLNFLVDCPQYPFDHSHAYWAESRLNRDFRLREAVVGDTLGSRVNDWNPLEPRWRNFWSTETTPWVGDHIVSGTTIYPAAGMLVMAMEALQQMAPPNRPISGYFFKQANFISPIIVKEAWDSRTETLFHLQPIQKAYEKESTWSDVKIFARYDGRWHECFRANVQYQYENTDDQLDSALEKRRADEEVRSRHSQAREKNAESIESQRFYEDSAQHGIKYGKCFQLLEDILWDGSCSTTLARVDVSGDRHLTNSVVHPAVLDAAFHALRVSATKGLSASSDTHVPMRLQDAWFAATGWQHPDTESIHYMATAKGEPGRENREGSLHALADNGTVLCTMKKLVTAQVAKEDETTATSKKQLHGIEWKPQLSLLNGQQLGQACGAMVYRNNEEAVIEFHKDLRLALDAVVCDTLRQLSAADRTLVPDSLRRQLVWMEHHAEQLKTQGDRAIVGKENLEVLYKELEKAKPSWKLFVAVARQLRPILLGEVDPLSVIFDSNLAEIFYQDMFQGICDQRLQKILELASHENPSLRILEVGAGTGGMTSHVLSTLLDLEERTGGLRFENYTYTDISPTFFENASIRWADIKQRIEFKTFDLERDAAEQGIELGSFDLVMAGSVLHATTDLGSTIQNVHRVLKPGGHLVLLEAIAPENVVTNFVFGLAPGWWNCQEEWRSLSPAIDEQRWDGCLKANGFSGNDVCIRDYKDDSCHIFSIILSTALPETPLAPPEAIPRVYLVVADDSTSQLELAQDFTETWAEVFHWTDFEIITLGGVNHLVANENDAFIVLLETEAPLLATISEDDFGKLQSLMHTAANLLWVTAADENDPQYPLYSTVQGFFRSIRNEAVEKHLVTLAVEKSPCDTPHDQVRYIASVFDSVFKLSSPELEFIVRNSQICTGRAIEEVALSEAQRSLLQPHVTEAPWLPGPALKLTIGTRGILDTLEYVDDDSHEEALGPQEIEIEAKAWGLNFRDLYIALGRLDHDSLGGDCAGVVTRIGSDCQGSVKPGDRVCMALEGCMKTYPRQRETLVHKIPDDISFEAAASIVVPGMTAYYALVDVARLRKGEKILVHSAAGATGQMALWIAKLKGAEIFATVGFEDKKRFLVEKFGIPEDHIFYSRNSFFAQGVMRVTNGYGVDVVLNSLSGDGLRASWECVAPYGRFIEIGKADIIANSALPMACFAKNVSFSAVDLAYLCQTDDQLGARIMKDTLGLLDQGAQHPGPLNVFPVSEAEKAFRYLQSGKNIGRIVIGIDRNEVVSKRIQAKATWRLREDASYLIAGGLGGLGRAIMKWMADRGAKHLIIPSRSGPTSKAARDVIAELTDRGVHVYAPKCDVSSAASLTQALQAAGAGAGDNDTPPIRGCINAAMVLQDAIFGNMTHAQWALTLASKAHTAATLHALLPPDDLDFSVQLSSLAGVCGTAAQSNYAAGCAAQDAAARQRRSTKGQNQAAVALDIGWMRDVGIIAEKAAYARHRAAAADMRQVDGKELLALLDLYCDPGRPVPVPAASPASPDQAQVLVGLLTPADFLARGRVPPLMHTRPLFAAFARLLPNGDSSASSSNGTEEDPAAAAQQFRASPPGSAARAAVVRRALAAKLARAMGGGLRPDDVQPGRPLSAYGVDSLMAVELRNYLGREFGAAVAVFDILGGVSIAAVADLVVERSRVGCDGVGEGEREGREEEEE
ncbi:hypothetical protein F4780DRAFT_797307 [Xylariomycetidae sp. FL0641]|nr:hypothetical protein F4780DRAFT_797307 [Xylariomycetidae sp. FL0641]